jgi:hypothetical protein
VRTQHLPHGPQQPGGGVDMELGVGDHAR